MGRKGRESAPEDETEGERNEREAGRQRDLIAEENIKTKLFFNW